MSKTLTRKFILFLLCAAFCSGTTLYAQAINEGFDDVSTLPAAGWSIQNNSSPIGSTSFFQGDAATFSSQSGAADSYIAADRNNVAPPAVAGTGTISDWLLTPQRTFKNGDIITFYTRTASALRADRLQVRMSSNGASTNVGTSATSTGDFTDLLLEINPNQTVGTYPTAFTQYTITISGLTAPTSGRIAFRYFVTAVTTLGVNANYIGIDNFVYTPLTCPTVTFTPATLPSAVVNSSYNHTITAASAGAGAQPAYGFTVTTGSLPPGLTLSSAGVLSGTPTTSGSYTFTITATDPVTACTGTKSYTIIITCPSITLTPATLPAGTAGTAYNQTISQTGGTGTFTYNVTSGSLPAGLTLSPSGTITGTATATGSSTFTITGTSTSGCTGVKSYTITTNCAANPVVFASTGMFCSNADSVQLAATPGGGTFSGTGVNGNDGKFSPASGTQTITYTYDSTYGCSYTKTQTVTIKQAPHITLMQVAPVCSDALPFSVSGAMPAGGTYSGTGLNGTVFSPSAGTQTITYRDTAANGCAASDSQVITVNQAPVVTLTGLPDSICSNAQPLVLTGSGSPSGGTFAGPFVSNNTFTTTNTGIYQISYTYTSAAGCPASAVHAIRVDNCSTGIGIVAAIGKNFTLTCFPNPTSGSLQIEIDADKEADAMLRVINMQGSIVLAEPLTITAGASYHTIDLGNYPKGIYMIHIGNSTSAVTQRILLQ